MRLQASAAALLAASVLFCSAAAASDLEAGLSWKVEFGASALKPSAGLTLGYRSADLLAPQSQLARLDLSESIGALTLAGLPLYQRSFRTDVTDGDVPTEESGTKPWYGRSWILWTVGGLAGTAALLSSVGGTSDNSGNEQNIVQGNSGDNSLTSANFNGVHSDDDGTDIGCVNGQCAVCTNGTSVSPDCAGGGFTARPEGSVRDALRSGDSAWLDEGTGYMGDLAELAP